jgi:4-hydroxyphenylpyruvate dioxygenase
MKRTQIAINSVSTTQQNLEEALAAYAEAGFANVEFVLPLVKDWIAQGHTLDDVRALLERYELRSIGGFQTHVACFAPPDALHANHDLLRENVRLIHELGGGTLVVGTDGPAQPSVEALDTVVAVFGELLRQVEGLNVTIALEFNWSPLIKSLHSAASVVQRVNHPQLGILFDPAHYHTTVTKFEHLTAEIVPLIKHVHLNDMSNKPGELSNCNSDRVLPGQGIIDLWALIDRLEEYGYNGYYSIEMFNTALWQLPTMVAARQCYQSLLSLCEE